MGEGLVWALNNPDNPLAQSILASAAQSVEDLSGGCQLGCAESKSEGGVLWAMNNPDNPIAQSILSDTAEALENNAGSGQTGGPENNPQNEPAAQASEADIRRIEILIAGGGVVDPPEDGGSPGGGDQGGDNPLTGGGQPITGGNPVSTNKLSVTGPGVQSLNDGEDPNDPDDLEGSLDVDAEQIRAGGLR
jgi:hypothetical protein